jgi:hypothetical protein
LASTTPTGAVTSLPHLKVIDLGLGQAATDKKYLVPALYVEERATWEIFVDGIPNEPQRLAAWENNGQGILKF